MLNEAQTWESSARKRSRMLSEVLQDTEGYCSDCDFDCLG